MSSSDALSLTLPLPDELTALRGEPLRRRHNALSRPYELTTNPLLEQQKERESNARSYPRRLPLALKRGQGIYVEDVEGRVFIDCLAGAGTLALGHNHPIVIEAIRQVLHDELPLHTLDLTTPVKEEFVDTLFGMLPPEFAANARIQFCGPTGADGIEAALKLVKVATGRHNVLSFHGAYHGMTQGTMNLTGTLGPKTAVGGLMSGVQFLPYPYAFRSPFGLDEQATATASLNYVENLLTDPESGVPTPACVITEIIQGEGGVIPAPDLWVQGLRELTRRENVPLVVDEVQTGFARTGKMFAFEHSGIQPDVLVLSKAIGGGLPLSVVVYRKELDQWKPGTHAGTFRGNQLAMAAGTATLRLLRSERLHEHAERMGQHLRRRLLEFKRDYPCIGDVRGKGLMVGMELVVPGGARNRLGHVPADPAAASRLQQACLRRGLILELGGRHGAVVRLLPPLIISEREVDHVADIIGTSLADSQHG
jgi:diaminobutyrate-2-oxoglutarate transaminase